MKARNVLLMFLLFVATAASYAAPSDSKAPRYGGELKVTINSDPASLDPTLESSESEQIPAAHIFETALAMDPEGDVHASVCTFDTKDDGMVIELAIRDGVKFHDGTTVTIEDVEASAKRWLANVNFAKGHIGAKLKSLGVADGKLVFTFEKPAPLALTTIATWDRGLYIFPKAVCEKYPDTKIENDFETRRKAWVELTKVLYEELPVITFGERTVAVVAGSEVRDIFDTTAKYYWNTWVDR